MAIDLDDYLATLPEEDRKAIRTRADELIAEEVSRMEHHHSDYRGWRLCITPVGPPEAPRYLGHGVRATRPHDVVMAEAATEAEALAELHRQVDVLEDVPGDVAARSADSPRK